MRRILLVLAVGLVMVAMLMASAIPAFAAASEKASCVGQAFSEEAPPGFKGQVVSRGAKQAGGVGQFISVGAGGPREGPCELF